VERKGKTRNGNKKPNRKWEKAIKTETQKRRKKTNIKR
jgi:hypothetical protein